MAVAQVKGLVASAATQLSMEEEEGAPVAGGAAEESTAATQVGRGWVAGSHMGHSYNKP